MLPYWLVCVVWYVLFTALVFALGALVERWLIGRALGLLGG